MQDLTLRSLAAMLEGQDLTLRSLAAMLDGLGYDVRLEVVKRGESSVSGTMLLIVPAHLAEHLREMAEHRDED